MDVQQNILESPENLKLNLLFEMKKGRFHLKNNLKLF